MSFKKKKKKKNLGNYRKAWGTISWPELTLEYRKLRLWKCYYYDKPRLRVHELL